MDPETTPPPAGLEITGDTAALFAALSAAQAEFGELRRTATAKIQTKAGGSYEFSYAPLDELLDAVLPALGKHGLWLGQPVSGGGDGYQLRTIIAHKSGAALTSTMRLPRSEDIKALGSTITYLRRYSLQALLGLAAEEDDDGSAGNGDGYQRQKRAPRPAPPAASFDLVVASIARAPDRETLEAIAVAQKQQKWSEAQREQIRAEINGRLHELKGAA
jgi:hypothetical protein